MTSLKARLIASTLGLVVVLWLCAAALTWLEARHEAEEIFDAHLAQAAALLIAQHAAVPADEARVADDGDDDHDRERGGDENDRHAPELHRYARKVAFQVWAGDRLLIHSRNAPDQRLSAVDAGFSDSEVGGEGWRVYASWNPQRTVLVQVGERSRARQALAREIAAGLLKPLLFALPLLALVLWLVVRRGLAPLSQAAAEIARRSPSHLDPLPLNGLPDEVRPLVERLNGLFERVARSIEQERRFTADAAHELRTPLAGLRAQAEVAMASRDDAARAHALRSVLAACDRGARLIEQLLLLARADAAEQATMTSSVPLAPLAGEVLAALAPEALARGVEVELIGADTVSAPGNAYWLSILLRNLVDNALRHAQSGQRVTVTVRQDGAGALLEVLDEGPGVPADALARLGERFHRVLDGEAEGAVPGSGLGLSIVRRIAQLHGGSVAFAQGDAGRGLRVLVRLPGP